MKRRSLERRTTLHCAPSWPVLADVSELNSPRTSRFISLCLSFFIFVLLFSILLSLIFFTACSALEMNNWKMMGPTHVACSELLIQREALYVQSERIISYSPKSLSLSLFLQTKRLPLYFCSFIFKPSYQVRNARPTLFSLFISMWKGHDGRSCSETRSAIRAQNAQQFNGRVHSHWQQWVH